MARRGRWWWLSGLLAAALGAGCDLGTLTYFLSPEDKEQPELKRLASDDKKKEVKVVILTYAALEPRTEFLQADRQLSELLARQLGELCKSNEEKVTIVPSRRVEEYKNLHPSRRGCDPVEVGQHFKADYVIYLEINHMDLYEKGCAHQLLRGRVNISVSLIDIAHPDDTEEPREFTYVYPTEAHGPIDVSPEMPPSRFRQEFLNSIARRLSWYFAPHSKRERVTEMTE
jgi:hypothetical protein